MKGEKPPGGRAATLEAQLGVAARALHANHGPVSLFAVFRRGLFLVGSSRFEYLPAMLEEGGGGFPEGRLWMSRVITEDDVIKHMEVPGARGIFVVGCFENRVTVLSQQVRALNLVYALRSRGRLREGSKAVVVGGGVAGMTAAAAAASVGCSVTLLEKEQVLLPLLRGNSTRWLHPYIYEWPAEGAERDEAGLPLLDWKAGTVNSVVTQFDEQWKELIGRLGIRTCLSVNSVDVPSDGRSSQHLVIWNAPGHDEGVFDAVFLTVGFGLERKVEGIQRLSYWDNDRLHQIARDGNERYLISGCGDGGLIDLLRARLLDFHQEKGIREFLEIPSLFELKPRLLAIEERARQEADPNAYINDQYKELPVPREVDQFIEKRLRKNIEVVLNGRERRPLNQQSSVLNRLLVSRLLFQFGVPYRPGEFSTAREGEQYKVQFRNGRAELFHHIVFRHGPHPSALEADFQDIWAKAGEMRARSSLDQTRTPLWPTGFFGGGPSGTKTSNPTAAPSPSVQRAKVTSPGATPPTPSSVEPPGQPQGERSAGASSRLSKGVGLLLGAGLCWFLLDGQQAPSPSRDNRNSIVNNNVMRTPTNLVPSEGGWGSRQRVERIEESDASRPILNGRKTLPRSAMNVVSAKALEDKPSPAPVPTNARVDTVQQLREVHRVRPVPPERGASRTLDDLPASSFCFIEPLPVFLYGRSRFSSEQDARGRSVEVHRLSDGQFHMVGYVWETESRAVATGRPVRVSLSPHPSGRSQNLVSIPFGRMRSVSSQNNGGALLLNLELGSSSGL